MTVTISDGAHPFSPDLVDGYSATIASRNIVHPIIGRASPDVTLKPSALRTGNLTLFFLTRADAWAAVAILEAAATFTYTDTDLPQTNMAFVVAGSLTPTLDPDTRLRWTVGLDFQEISA